MNAKSIQAVALALTISASPASAELSFRGLVDYLEAGMKRACELYPDCTRRVTSFTWFLWSNRDKADIQYHTMKCLGYSAVQRGYVWSPMKLVDELTPTTAQEISVEVCTCVVGYWGKDQVCPIKW
ncbi:hypothetical protein GHK33_20600 [Sinorhizobium meliloti]|uniref:Uncharacterized protein n=1 Tax=Rhizobium meliloti TaxID=382 RepID=A0A6A7ZXV8_RHIML|nr:hypothetical protein [Sinorhizobium meliloti]MDW9376825.1 hypothetical protein [Sinorhizobium meliloti]MDW9495363.1 hypothetical protein [Sinorhizobium meliloti]MDW9563718.1 hypothetical protein [Sinorhizobium meliloti]MDW9651148.1 hypothetical protein [Sinorhizobium meliloti]MDW9861602.1 hypothetical protein [Sinorhizobium meliloti]